MSAQRWILGLFGVLLAPALACAALGEREATVQEDAAKLKGAIKSTERSAFRVHEIQLPSGTALREFVGPDGRVFAVAWKGPALPNLSQVLGAYFDTYAGAAKAKQGSRTHLDIQQSGFIMHSGGHMRAFSGHAYLPQAVPAGTALEDIR
jgi:Protein of unknown function (DUF2844)